MHIAHAHSQLTRDRVSLVSNLLLLIERTWSLRRDLADRLAAVEASIRRYTDTVERARRELVRNFSLQLEGARRELSQYERQLALFDPRRVLQLGYSIVRKSGTILRDAGDVAVGDRLNLQLFKGTLLVRTEKIDKSTSLSL